MELDFKEEKTTIMHFFRLQRPIAFSQSKVTHPFKVKQKSTTTGILDKGLVVQIGGIGNLDMKH